MPSVQDDVIDPLIDFAKSAVHFINRCTKPDRKEFMKFCVATAGGFLVMGGLGFFIKLIHIPINNILLGA